MPRLEFIDEGHVYLLDGVRVPSNTQLLKGAGLVDDRFYTDEGRERGTAVHDITQLMDEDVPGWSMALVPAHLRPYVEAYQSFKLQTGFHVEFIETMIWSEHGFATRLDRVGILNGRRVLIDLKTGAVSKWVGVQLAGQYIALTERIRARDLPVPRYIDGHPYPVDRFGLQLKKDGKYKLHPFRSPLDHDAFLATVKLYHEQEVDACRLVLERWKVAA